MGHQFRKMRGVTRACLVRRHRTGAQADAAAVPDRARQSPCRRAHRRDRGGGYRRDDRGAVDFFVPIKQSNLDEIARRPAGEFFEALELACIRSTPAGRISRFRRCLEFDKGARRRACSIKRDIRPADARIQKLRRNGQPLRYRQTRNQPLKQLLECRGERCLRNIRVRSTKLPNSVRVGLQEEDDAHGLLPPKLAARVIITQEDHAIAEISTLPFVILGSFRLAASVNAEPKVGLPPDLAVARSRQQGPVRGKSCRSIAVW